MRSLYLVCLLVFCSGLSAQMAPGLISAEGFFSYRPNVRYELGLGEISYITRIQTGAMLNGWLSENVFIGVGAGKITYEKTYRDYDEKSSFEGTMLRVHAGFGTSPTHDKRFFLGGKLRYSKSQVSFTDALGNRNAPYWSAGFVGFIGFMPIKNFIISIEPFSYEYYKLGPVSSVLSSETEQGALPSITINLQVHLCFNLLKTEDKSVNQGTLIQM